MSTSPNRMLGIILGVVYMAVGMFGFFLTSSTGFFAAVGPKFLGLFGVNPMVNLSHLFLGIVLLLAALIDWRLAKLANLLVGLLFLAVGGIAILISGSNPLNVLALNGADAVLYLATAVVLLVVALGADHLGERSKEA